jgi:hypothetical protein
LIGIAGPIALGVALALSSAPAQALPVGALMASPPPVSTPPPSAPGFTLVGQALTDDQLKAKIAAGAVDARIVEVKLSSNRIGPAGVAALLASPIRAVQTLVLYDNQIADAGARALARSPKIAGVGHLDVSYNQLTSSGVQALLGPTSALRGPTYVSVAGNAIGDAGIKALVASSKLVHVDTLNVRRVGLTDAGVAAIVSADLPKLTRLNVSGNALTATGRAALAPLQARGVRVDF